MTFAEQQIIDLFTSPLKTMTNGLWFSMIYGEGEFKQWFVNGILCEHSYYKGGEKNGECKLWWRNGQLYTHAFYKNNKKDGECKVWNKNGELDIHTFYKDGKKV